MNLIKTAARVDTPFHYPPSRLPIAIHVNMHETFLQRRKKHPRFLSLSSILLFSIYVFFLRSYMVQMWLSISHFLSPGLIKVPGKQQSARRSEDGPVILLN